MIKLFLTLLQQKSGANFSPAFKLIVDKKLQFFI